MPRQIKAFVTCDSFIDNQSDFVSPLFELSDIAETYTRRKQEYYSSEDSLYSLHVFSNSIATLLSLSQANSILRVVKEFVIYCSATRHLPKSQILIGFMSNYNQLNPNQQVSDLSVGGYIEAMGTQGVDYMFFKVLDIECGVWLNDLAFRGFYPEYEVNIILPFVSLPSIVQNSSQMLAALAAFNLIEFNTRIELAKGMTPTTHMRIINIPYKLPNSTIVKDCFFAFNQYGSQGNYDYVLKLRLYDYFLGLGLTSQFIESIFPSILQINEFFIVPRWDKFAIPSGVGQKGILSQITKSYESVFDMDKYVKIYPDLNYLRANTYNVPYDYNNVLLAVSNGFYTESAVRDFAVVYSDIMSVTSSHPDFGRMRQKTQRFLTMLESMLYICDSPTSSRLFTKMVENTNYKFHMVSRQGVWYLTYLFDEHQYYMLPSYQFAELSV